MAQGRATYDAVDQASRLRDLVRRRRRSRRQGVALAITSGKGGVGKSSVAVNLSISLASRGVRVTLVDVDMGLANADLLLNIQPRYTLSHVLSGVRSIEEIVTSGPEGLRFVPGASGIHQLADLTEFERQTLITQFQKLRANADIIVFDCGAGISRNVMSFALSADRVIVVTTPEPTALTDAYATIKSLHRERCRGSVGLFVNMVESQKEAQATYDRVAKVSQRFLNYPVANQGYMLHDRAVELAVQARCPFVVRYPGSNASTCMAAMASSLVRTPAGGLRRGGLFSRVAGLFV